MTDQPPTDHDFILGYLPYLVSYGCAWVWWLVTCNAEAWIAVVPEALRGTRLDMYHFATTRAKSTRG